ncbi:hypothetical protein SKAU_G00103560 [Synaphobranchus kaupii]|uniref:Uncharacterized protein n=1 Tax=Synaphobranchus kaupii TaxID=118154 RepID=A0A9Q1FYW2_SYNKA|nr:hypothetical protein SKAU_G00103560 [Synaphobranchus kaupii]
MRRKGGQDGLSAQPGGRLLEELSPGGHAPLDKVQSSQTAVLEQTLADTAFLAQCPAACPSPPFAEESVQMRSEGSDGEGHSRHLKQRKQASARTRIAGVTLCPRVRAAGASATAIAGTVCLNHRPLTTSASSEERRPTRASGGAARHARVKLTEFFTSQGADDATRDRSQREACQSALKMFIPLLSGNLWMPDRTQSQETQRDSGNSAGNSSRGASGRRERCGNDGQRRVGGNVRGKQAPSPPLLARPPPHRRQGCAPFVQFQAFGVREKRLLILPHGHSCDAHVNETARSPEIMR